MSPLVEFYYFTHSTVLHTATHSAAPTEEILTFGISLF